MIPEISIIIPAYKAVPFIGRLLSQIYAQDFDKDFECIVVDDCSPDDTPGAFRKAAESCPPHINLKYLRNEVNRGPAFTRNEGIRAATGKYILMFDCDDEITPDCLSVIWNTAEKYGFPDMVVGSIICESPKVGQSDFVEKGLPDYVGTHEEAKALIIDVWSIPQTPDNKLIKRELFESHPNIFFKEDVRIAEDMCWTFYLAKAVNTMALAKKPTYVYKLVPTGLTQTNDGELYCKSYTIIMDDVLKHIDDPCREGQLKLVKRFYWAWVAYNGKFNSEYERAIRLEGGHITWEERKPRLKLLMHKYFSPKRYINYIKKHLLKKPVEPKTR